MTQAIATAHLTWINQGRDPPSFNEDVGPPPFDLEADHLEDDMQRMPTWPILRYVEQQEQRMADMMDRLDVDVVAAARLNQGNAFANARSACLFCRNVRDCDRWPLAHGEGPRPDEFCNNFAFFARCARPGHKPD